MIRVCMIGVGLGGLFACSAPPRGWVVELHGSVLDSQGLGVVGALAEVDNVENGEFLGQVVTDENGVWRLPVFVSEEDFEAISPLRIAAEASGMMRGESFWEFSWRDTEWPAMPISIGPGQEVALGQQRTAGVVLFEEAGIGTASGRVRNAVNGGSLGQITLRFRSGWNAPLSAEVVGETTSSSTGDFQITLDDPGMYTVQAEASGGFETTLAPIWAGAGSSKSQTILMSPMLQGEAMRASLIWRSASRDLDLHMSGPLAAEGGRYQVYVSDTPHPIYGDPIAQVEHASGNWETIGAYTLRSGEYRFSAHDRENGQALDSVELAAEEPTLLLWTNNGPVMESLSPGAVGTLWQAMEYDTSSGLSYRLQGMSEGEDEWDVSAF